MDGRALHKGQVSTDDDTANLRELKGEILDFTYNEGTGLEERTSAGHDIQNFVPRKAGPSVEIDFNPRTVGASSAYRTVFHDTGGQRVMDFQGQDGGAANSGWKLTGFCRVDTPALVYNAALGRYTMRVTLRPVGTAWAKGLVTD